MTFVFLTGIILNEVFCFVEVLWRIVLNLQKTTKDQPKGESLPPNTGGSEGQLVHTCNLGTLFLLVYRKLCLLFAGSVRGLESLEKP